MPIVEEPEFLTLTREGYDRTAAVYADRFHHHLEGKPIDRAMVSAFADLVMHGDNTRVVDVGCGTGVTTAMLASSGAEVIGIDLSANMVAEAQRLNPALQFSVGSMTDLAVADRSVGGVCAWYSIIHIPDAHLAGVFAEFYRVLVPGGVVLVAFQVGDKPRVLTSVFDQEVALTFIRRRPRHVAECLANSGLRVCAELVREPDDDGFESTSHAYLIARKTLVPATGP
jgi:ubiquinone/menaquinone biosynthesis C-methylase UbiE